MKTFIALLLIYFSSLFFAACKKNSDSKPTYYMKADIGGTEKTYATNAEATRSGLGRFYFLTMRAIAGNNSSEGLILSIEQLIDTFTTGTYTERASNDYDVTGTYNPGSSDPSAVFETDGLLGALGMPLKITISEISDTQVAGTFSGEFFGRNGSDSNSILITDGEFNLPIH